MGRSGAVASPAIASEAIAPASAPASAPAKIRQAVMAGCLVMLLPVFRQHCCGLVAGVLLPARTVRQCGVFFEYCSGVAVFAFQALTPASDRSSFNAKVNRP